MTQQDDKTKTLEIQLKLMRCGGCNKYMGENQPHCAFCYWVNDELIGITPEFKPDIVHHPKSKWSLSGNERKEINDRFESNAH